ncbi:hypothetical protein [Agaribacter marinus]|uniref:PEP-CTERM sorting domain-containing protein n=1 Tax=Agaribacter marinus TaxID=1431249 RepID=A0AA37T1Q9_9ALTE|nr:hypothetical protein [Agaribacter marinus]GLR72011.1 hypothetical protein GCM10007852_29190 [Agaribacter marinus]
MKTKNIKVALGLASLLSMSTVNASIIDISTSADAAFDDVLTSVSAADQALPGDNRSVSASVFGFGYGASASGNKSGQFFVNSSVNTSGSSFAEYQQTFNVLNNTGITQAYEFDFEILGGGLSVGCDTGDGDGEFPGPIDVATVENGFDALSDVVFVGDACAGVSLVSSYNASIALNGVEIWNSLAALSYDSIFGANLVTDGETLGTYLPGANNYFWNTFSSTEALGELLDGESFELTYTVTSESFAVSLFPGIGGGDDEISPFFAFTGFGDPTGIGANAIRTVQVNNVNSPLLGMFGLLGVFSLLAFRRSK